MDKISYSCKLGVLTRPDGSAIFCQGENRISHFDLKSNVCLLGDTTVMAGIYGPLEVKMQKMLIDKASVECCYRPKTGAPGIFLYSFFSQV